MPFLLQIFQGLSTVGPLNPKRAEYELKLNELVISLWLSQILPQALSQNTASPTLVNISFALKQYSSLSRLSQYSPSMGPPIEEDYDFSSLKQELAQLSIDDSIYSQVNDNKIIELTCILNPSRLFCPERILFTSNFDEPIKFYILLQRYLSNSSRYLIPSFLTSNEAFKSNLCSRVQNTTEALPEQFPKLTCPTDPAGAPSILSAYLETLNNFEQFFTLAVNLNIDRIRKSTPWGQRDKANLLVKILYLKDLQVTFDELEFASPKKSYQASVYAEIRNELTTILKENSNENTAQ